MSHAAFFNRRVLYVIHQTHRAQTAKCSYRIWTTWTTSLFHAPYFSTSFTKISLLCGSIYWHLTIQINPLFSNTESPWRYIAWFCHVNLTASDPTLQIKYDDKTRSNPPSSPVSSMSGDVSKRRASTRKFRCYHQRRRPKLKGSSYIYEPVF